MNWRLLLILLILFILIVIIRALLLNTVKKRPEIIGRDEPHIESVIAQEYITYYDPDAKEERKYETNNSLYVSWDTNKQIQQIIKYSNINQYSRLIRLIFKYVPERGLKRNKAVVDLLTDKSDDFVYHYLSSHFHYNNEKRSKIHGEELYAKLRPYLPTVRSYLDIGCGDGKITNEMRRLLDLPKASCVEVNKKYKLDNVEYYYVGQEDRYKLPYADGSFDLITAFLSLHHIKDVSAMASEIIRVLAPNGLLYLKEHNCWTGIDAMLVDIQHRIFIECLEKSSDPNPYIFTYMNYNAIRKLFAELQLLKTDYYYTTPENIRDPTNIYYAIFQKPTAGKNK